MDLNKMTIPQLKEYANTLGVNYPSKVLKAVLIEMIETREKEIARNYMDSMHLDKHIEEALTADSSERVPVKLKQKGWNHSGPKGEPMPLGYRGRALGLKDYKATGLAIGRTAAGFDGQLIPRGFAAHKPNSERVQNYTYQNSFCDQEHGGGLMPKLTPRQMRRVRKNANKHGEGFLVTRGPERQDVYSLLARTPEGLGIYHNFLKGL